MSFSVLFTLAPQELELLLLPHKSDYRFPLMWLLVVAT